MVEKYSKELVDKWNSEIDGLLTFVSILSPEHTRVQTAQLTEQLGWSLHRYLDNVQRAIVSASSGLSDGSDQCHTHANVRSVRELPPQSVLRQLYSASLRMNPRWKNEARQLGR